MYHLLFLIDIKSIRNISYMIFFVQREMVLTNRCYLPS